MADASVWIEAAGRSAVYLPGLWLLGLVAWRLLLWPRVRGASHSPRAETDRSLARAGLALALLLVAGVLARGVAQTANTFDLSGALDPDHLRTVMLESRWGGRFRRQLFAAVALLASFVWARIHPPSGWAAAAGAGAAFCVVLPHTGHAMSHGPLALAAQAAHAAGAGLWIGTLAAAVGGERWIAGAEGRVNTGGHRWTPAGASLARFAPIAATGAFLLVASGAVTAYLYLPDLESLWTTSWGRMLLGKVLGVVVIGSLGFVNFRRFRRTRLDDSAPPSLRLPRLEVVVALAVVLATAVLTALPSPGA